MGGRGALHPIESSREGNIGWGGTSTPCMSSVQDLPNIAPCIGSVLMHDHRAR